MKALSLFLILVLVIGAVGCGRNGGHAAASGEKTGGPAATAAGQAGSGAAATAEGQAGSGPAAFAEAGGDGIRPTAAADQAASGPMCLEHGVLEAVCTKCNPALVPVFKAKGDWCAEHEFPESICPICHPERGGRPQGNVTGQEPPATGTKIIFKSIEVAREAGIRTVKASPGAAAGDVRATATIAADASRTARINARAAGVVRSIAADVGSRVARGAPLGTIESAALAESRSRLVAAQARERTALAARNREKELFDKGISSAREVEAAEQELEAARAEVAAGRAALEMVGAGVDASGTYTLRSPISGVVTRRNVSIGTLVETTEALFEVVDVSRLWAEIDVPERDASRVTVGQIVFLEVDGSDREFGGNVEFVAPVIDPATRTVRARAALDNSSGALRANMYARARIAVASAVDPVVIVPREAVQEARGASLVFVRLAEDVFETRRVAIAPAGDDFFAVKEGLTGGEDVVTVGAFLLKTETLKESIGAGCCDVEAPR